MIGDVYPRLCYHWPVHGMGRGMVDWQCDLLRMEVFQMSVGPVTIFSIVAAALATLLWWAAGRLGAPAWVCMFLFGVALALVILAGPLIKLP